MFPFQQSNPQFLVATIPGSTPMVPQKKKNIMVLPCHFTCKIPIKFAASPISFLTPESSIAMFFKAQFHWVITINRLLRQLSGARWSSSSGPDGAGLDLVLSVSSSLAKVEGRVETRGKWWISMGKCWKTMGMGLVSMSQCFTSPN